MKLTVYPYEQSNDICSHNLSIKFFALILKRLETFLPILAKET
jgi:hypothetical protein